MAVDPACDPLDLPKPHRGDTAPEDAFSPVGAVGRSPRGDSRLIAARLHILDEHDATAGEPVRVDASGPEKIPIIGKTALQKTISRSLRDLGNSPVLDVE